MHWLLGPRNWVTCTYELRGHSWWHLDLPGAEDCKTNASVSDSLGVACGEMGRENGQVLCAQMKCTSKEEGLASRWKHLGLEKKVEAHEEVQTAGFVTPWGWHAMEKETTSGWKVCGSGIQSLCILIIVEVSLGAVKSKKRIKFLQIALGNKELWEPVETPPQVLHPLGLLNISFCFTEPESSVLCLCKYCLLFLDVWGFN